MLSMWFVLYHCSNFISHFHSIMNLNVQFRKAKSLTENINAKNQFYRTVLAALRLIRLVYVVTAKTGSCFIVNFRERVDKSAEHTKVFIYKTESSKHTSA